MLYYKLPYLTLALIICASCNSIKSNNQFDYPKAPKLKVEEDIFGIRIIDDYRSLEDLSDQEVVSWYAGEDTITERYFNKNQKYKELKEYFIKLQNQNSSYINGHTVTESGDVFYLDWVKSQSAYYLYYKNNLDSDPIILFDPTQYKDGSYSIREISPSFDGNKIAIALGKGADFHSEIIIVETKTKKQINDRITAKNAAPDFAGGIQWIPEKDMIAYLYFPNVGSKDHPVKEGSYTVLFDIKTGQNYKLFGSTDNLEISKRVYPIVKIRSQNDSYIQGYIGHAGRYWKAYKLPMSSIGKKENFSWEPFFSEKDSIIYGSGVLKDSFCYFMKTHNAKTVLGRRNFSPNEPGELEVLAESYSNDEITDFVILKDKILFSRLYNGTNASLFSIDSDGAIKEVKLPFRAGKIDLQSKSVNYNDAWVRLSGWSRNWTNYSFDTSSNQLKRIDFASLMSLPEFDNIISEQVTVTGHDGVQIPLTIIRNKSNTSISRLIIEAYGAYGDILKPFYSPKYLNWVEQGGVLAFAHVRGGGEKGPKWHEDGMKDKKINSWKDLISCAEYLVAEGFTSPDKMALYTSSAGGITGGMAVNTRPDLFSAFISLSPRLNPVRTESSSKSSSSYREYGSIKDSTDAKYLIKMDPYLNINPSLTYPPTLILSGFHDDRIPISDGGKYIAKLQSFGNNGKPYLLDIDYHAGHSGSTDWNDLYARIFAFIYENVQ